MYNNNQPRTLPQVTDYSGGGASTSYLRPTSYSSLGLQSVFNNGSNTNPNAAPAKGIMPVKPNIMEEFTQSRRDG